MNLTQECRSRPCYRKRGIGKDSTTSHVQLCRPSIWTTGYGVDGGIWRNHEGGDVAYEQLLMSGGGSPLRRGSVADLNTRSMLLVLRRPVMRLGSSTRSWGPEYFMHTAMSHAVAKE